MVVRGGKWVGEKEEVEIKRVCVCVLFFFCVCGGGGGGGERQEEGEEGCVLCQEMWERKSERGREKGGGGEDIERTREIGMIIIGLFIQTAQSCNTRYPFRFSKIPHTCKETAGEKGGGGGGG